MMFTFPLVFRFFGKPNEAQGTFERVETYLYGCVLLIRGAFYSAKNHKRQRRKRQSVTAIREKSQTP